MRKKLTKPSPDKYRDFLIETKIKTERGKNMFGNYGIEIPPELFNEAEKRAVELGITIASEITEGGKILVSSKLHPSTPERKELDNFLFSLQKTELCAQT